MTRRLFLWLLLAIAPLRAQTAGGVRPLTILHSNDLHAHLVPDDQGRGGFARLATAVQAEKAHCTACLYLNAGDLVQGTPVSTYFRGLPIYEIANQLGFDAGTLGNHEFDYGWKRVQQFAKTADYPMLSANVVDSKGLSLTGKPFVILKAGGVRVAIIGVVLGDLRNLVLPSTVGSWRILPVVDTVRKYARRLRDQADLIVVLGHIHDDTEVRTILEQVPEVSIVIAGHNHVGYSEMMNVEGRVGVLVNAYGTELGRLDVQVDLSQKKLRSAEWKKIPIDSRIRPDPAAGRSVAAWESKVSKLVDFPIGESKRRLEGAELRALAERAVAEETGSDFAFISSGNFRDALPQGRILARNVWNVFPFETQIVVGKFRGNRLPDAVKMGRTIDPDREYTLATTDYSEIHQDLPSELGTTGLRFPRTEGQLRDLVIAWIKKHNVLP